MAVIESSQNWIERLIASIDLLCIPSPQQRLELASHIKEYFNYSVSESSEYGNISELIVNEMDSESIWEQIQTRSRPLLRSLESEIAILNQTLKSVNSNEIHHDLNGSKDINHQQEEELSSFESEEDQLEFQSTQSSQSDGDEPIRNVEDDMEEFLDEVDQVEEKRLAEIDDPYSATKGSTLEYEDDLNLVINELYDLSDESESEENLRYDDFFTTKSSSKQLRSNSDSDSASDQEIRDSDDSDLEDESENGNGQPVSQADAMTTHAKERQKLQNRIAEFESQLLEPKSWERKGEVMSGDRPENSLLGLAVAVERASKSAPIITPEYSKTIEDMIIARIKESNFSNIAFRKTSQTNVQLGPVDLSQEKSNLGLGEVYAQQFMKDSLHFDQTDEKLKESKEKLLSQFKKVCRQLDGLSHFYFSPKPEVQELSVKPMAVASISLEDVLPGTSVGPHNSTLAPEQIYEKKRGRDAAFLSINEADRDDRQRLRRAKKAARNRSRKIDAPGDLRDSKDRRIIIASDSALKSQKFSKSSTFFSHLQQNVAAGVRKSMKETVQDKVDSSQRLKL